MKRTVATVTLAAAIVVAPIGLGSADAKKAPAPKLPVSMSRPCQDEGMNNCYWDAKRFGNGVGKSYVVRDFPGKGPVCVMYVAKRDRHLDFCE